MYRTVGASNDRCEAETGGLWFEAREALYVQATAQTNATKWFSALSEETIDVVERSRRLWRVGHGDDTLRGSPQCPRVRSGRTSVATSAVQTACEGRTWTIEDSITDGRDIRHDRTIEATPNDKTQATVSPLAASKRALVTAPGSPQAIVRFRCSWQLRCLLAESSGAVQRRDGSRACTGEALFRLHTVRLSQTTALRSGSAARDSRKECGHSWRTGRKLAVFRWGHGRDSKTAQWRRCRVQAEATRGSS